jgi:hypothetical protein
MTLNIRVREWNIVEQLPEEGKEPGFSVIVMDPDISTRPILVKIPYTGITDTTITPETHDLYMTAERLQSGEMKASKDHVYFRKRTEGEEGGVPGESPFPNTPIGSTFADTVPTRRKAILDDKTGVGVTVSEVTTAFGKPGREMLVGKSGVTMLSGSPTIASLPEEDLLLFKQKGIGQLLPQCFVPPFCFPEYMPNLEIVGQIGKVVGILKAIRGLA